ENNRPRVPLCQIQIFISGGPARFVRVCLRECVRDLGRFLEGVVTHRALGHLAASLSAALSACIWSGSEPPHFTAVAASCSAFSYCLSATCLAAQAAGGVS